MRLALRTAVLACLFLTVAACDWFVPEGQTIVGANEFSAAQDTFTTHVVFESAETDPREGLARCLTERGIVLYGTNWCPACLRQKDMFGSYANLLNEVNCNAEPERCDAVHIRAVPTWVFPDGSRHEGVRTLSQLARRSHCPYPTR